MPLFFGRIPPVNNPPPSQTQSANAPRPGATPQSTGAAPQGPAPTQTSDASQSSWGFSATFSSNNAGPGNPSQQSFGPRPGQPSFPHPVFGRPVPPNHGAPVFVPFPGLAQPAYPQCTREVIATDNRVRDMAQEMERGGWSYVGQTEHGSRSTLHFQLNPFVRKVLVHDFPSTVHGKQAEMVDAGWLFEGHHAEGSFNKVLTFLSPSAPTRFHQYPQRERLADSSRRDFEGKAHDMERDGWSYKSRRDLGHGKQLLRFELNPSSLRVVVGMGPAAVRAKEREMADQGLFLDGRVDEGAFNQVLTFRPNPIPPRW